MITTIVILSIVVVVLLFVVFAASHATQRLIREIKYLEDILDAKNEALSYYVEAYQETFDELMDLTSKISAPLLASFRKRPVGRPKGSKNKVVKPKFDKQKFNDKYGK